MVHWCRRGGPKSKVPVSAFSLKVIGPAREISHDECLQGTWAWGHNPSSGKDILCVQPYPGWAEKGSGVTVLGEEVEIQLYHGTIKSKDHKVKEKSISNYF
jgi:hypothetical protein